MPELKLTKKQETTLLNRVWADYQFGRQERRNRVESWHKWRKQYDSEWSELSAIEKDEDIDDEWFFVPKTRIHISRIKAAMQQHFFPRERRKLAKVLPPELSFSDDAKNGAQIGDAVLHAKLDLLANPEATIVPAIEGGLVEGDGWVKFDWLRGQTRDGRMVNEPRLTYLDNEDVTFDPFARRIEEVQWVVQNVRMSVDQLYEKKGTVGYKHVDEVVKLAKNPDDSDDSERLEGIVRSNRGESGNKQRNVVHLLQFWGRVQVRDDAELERLHQGGKHPEELDVFVTVYENKYILYAETNPYVSLMDNPKAFDKLPFFKCSPNPRRIGVYGDSVAEIMRPIQKEVNTMRNQRRIAVGLETNPKVFYDQSRLTDLDRWFSARYGGPVPTNGPPGDIVHQFSMQTSTGILDREESIASSDMVDVTGVTPFHLGQTQPGLARTATGVSTITAEGNVTMETMIDNVNRTLVLPLTKFAMQACIEWTSPDEVAEILQWEPPNPIILKDMLPRDFSVDVETGLTATSKNIQLQQVQAALSSITQLAQILPEPTLLAVTELMGKMLHLLNLGDVDKFYRTADYFNQTYGAMLAEGGQGGNQPKQLSQGAAQMGMNPNRQVTPFETPNR